MTLLARPFKLVRTDGLQRVARRRPDTSLSRDADPLEVSGLSSPQPKLRRDEEIGRAHV